ncbi:MAG: Ig-like domain-containing protein [Nitrospinae bacterium]|nr:Ig-like domain-containing protein [Nitrospinota bacterium]
MKIFNKMWIITFLIAVFMAGHTVNANGALPDAKAPTVRFTRPANGDTSAALDNKIVVTFSESMKPSTITKRTFTLKKGTKQISGTVAYAGVTATFTPAKSLADNTEYTATITTGAKDRAGNKLANKFVWSFTTASATGDTTAPIVSFTHPANGNKGAALDKKIAVAFSEAMDPSTITKLTFTLKKGAKRVSGKVTYAGVTAAFTPAKSLAANTKYTATITTGAKDPAGNKLASKFEWSFTTGAEADATAPTVSSTGAANGATGLPIDRKATVIFSEAMDPLTITKRTFTLKKGTKRVSGKVTYAGVTATFTPASNLKNNTEYTCTVTTGAKDLAGNALASDYVWSWTTGSSTDTTAPTVSSTVPANGATGVATNEQVAAAFSEMMDPLTITTANFTLTQGTTPVSGTVAYVGVTAAFSPLSPLAAETLYTATITTGAKDLAGNALASNFVWTFTTGAAADTTAPTVSSTNPANGATGVALNQQVAAVFTETMDPLTITTANFTLTQGTTPVSGTVAYVGATASFSQLSPLAASTLYTATITTGAKDLAGNALAVDKVWSFTTGAAKDTTAPTVSFTNPANGATGVALNQQVAATFSEAMDPVTITTANFTLMQGATPVAGAVTYVGVTATFTPASNLTASTAYTATITTVAKDLAGNALAVDKVWSFTTGAATDTTAPTVSSTVPVDGATMVVLNQQVAATFSEAMDPVTITTATFTLTQGATPVAGAVAYAGVTATFTPASNLTASTIYTARITTVAKDLAGNALAVDKVWSFTTGAVTGQLTVNLGLAGNYAILTKTGISTTGATLITGDIGVSPIDSTAMTGFGLILDASNQFATSSLVVGKAYAADYAPPTPANLTTTVSNMETAYTDAAGRTLPNATELGAGEIGGMTITPGLYKWGTGVLITTDVTLNGNPDDIWIFQIAGNLTVANGKSVILSGGAQARNIFWQVAGGVGVEIGTTAHMEGTILAAKAINVRTGASWNGRALAQTAVTLDANAITKPD